MTLICLPRLFQTSQKHGRRLLLAALPCLSSTISCCQADRPPFAFYCCCRSPKLICLHCARGAFNNSVRARRERWNGASRREMRDASQADSCRACQAAKTARQHTTDLHTRCSALARVWQTICTTVHAQAQASNAAASCCGEEGMRGAAFGSPSAWMDA